MAGCGYVCPQCEGKGFVGSGEACDYCQLQNSSNENLNERDEWIKNVHEGPCCSDPSEE